MHFNLQVCKWHFDGSFQLICHALFIGTGVRIHTTTHKLLKLITIVAGVIITYSNYP